MSALNELVYPLERSQAAITLVLGLLIWLGLIMVCDFISARSLAIRG